MAIRMVMPCKYCPEKLPVIATLVSSDDDEGSGSLTTTYTFEVIDHSEAERHVRQKHPEAFAS